MSNEIDWSKAPEGATHWGPAVGGYCEAWVKSDMVGWLCLPTSGGAGWIREQRLISNLVERPISEYQRPWSGEGLPPVGTICEIAASTKYLTIGYPEGTRVKVYANFTDDRGVDLAAFVDDIGQVGGVASAKCFRPIRTPEQIAAEKREREISDIERVIKAAHYGLVRTDISPAERAKHYAGALHNAGYRKTEQEQDQ